MSDNPPMQRYRISVAISSPPYPSPSNRPSSSAYTLSSGADMYSAYIPPPHTWLNFRPPGVLPDTRPRSTMSSGQSRECTMPSTKTRALREREVESGGSAAIRPMQVVPGMMGVVYGYCKVPL